MTRKPGEHLAETIIAACVLACLLIAHEPKAVALTAIAFAVIGLFLVT